MQMRGRHVLGIVVVVLGLLSVLATERYTARYQTLPVLDWLESRPPLFESSDVPPATELARGLVRAVPMLSIQYDARTVAPDSRPACLGPAQHQWRARCRCHRAGPAWRCARVHVQFARNWR